MNVSSFGINAITVVTTVLLATLRVDFLQSSHKGGRVVAPRGRFWVKKSLKGSRGLLTGDVLERVYCEIARAAPDIFVGILTKQPTRGW